MTFSNAQSLRARRRPAIIRACGLGLALALAVPALAANAANPAVQGAVAKPKVSQIDFKRGGGHGAGAGGNGALVRRGLVSCPENLKSPMG